MQPRTFTVSQANRLIKSAIDVEMLLKSIAIIGEISNLKYHTSGHIYFTLKDESNVLKCVMFKKHASFLPLELKNGMSVMAIGEVTFYEKNGTVTLNCEAIMPKGQGLISQQFAELKERLNKEGYFDYKKKKSLPKYPEKVAVVTSATGSVIQDIKNVANRRNKGIEILLAPVKVQGDSADINIVETIKYINKNKLADVIIIARGGGSNEDLDAFNMEIVVRAVFNSKIPVVSAVGHETDTTLCDLVADVRASTPSEAAELVFTESEEMRTILEYYKLQMDKIVDDKINNQKNKLQHINDFELYNKAMFFVKLNKSILENKMQSINNEVGSKLTVYKNDINIKIAKMEKYNPLEILKQGYTLVYKDDEVVEKAENIDINDTLEIKFKDGKVKTAVEKIDLD